MANNRFNNFYQTTPQPGVVGGINACTNWAPFQTYTQHSHIPIDNTDRNIATTLKGGNFRFLLLILGPMGSGKTAVIDYLKRYATLINNVGVRAGGEWVQQEVSYDHHITNHPDYKQRINKIISPSRSTLFPTIAPPTDEGAHRAQQRIARIVNNPQLHHRLQNAYETTRRGELTQRERERIDKYIKRRKDFGFQPPPPSAAEEARHRRRRSPRIRKATTGAADIAVYRNLRNSISEGRNIVFELTGKKWRTPKKIFQTLVTSTNSCNNFRYIVLAALNIIDVNENRRRIVERFRNQMVQYLHNPEGAPAPRMPNPSLTTLQQNKELIYKNMKDLIKLCTTKSEKDISIDSNIGLCPGVGIDLLFIFDQNKYDWRVGEEHIGTPRQTIFPSAVIPLSKRSIYITRYTNTYNVKFTPAIRQRVGDILEGEGEQEGQLDPMDPILIGAKKKFEKGQLRARLRKKIAETKKKSGRRGGGRKKTVRRRKKKKSTKRRTYRYRSGRRSRRKK